MSESFVLPGGAGFCNAVRRTLLSDLQMWAPKELKIRVNTSCQTDEYIAHRVGLIPFRRVGNGDTVTLRAKGPGTVTSKEFVGCAFEPVHDFVEVMLLGEDQELDFDVYFDRQRAGKHARYSPCAAVGMCKVDGEGRHKITFESISGESPLTLMLQALDALDARVDRAFLSLANQPTIPPQSMC